MSAPKRKREVQLNFRVSPEELALIEQKMRRLALTSPIFLRLSINVSCIFLFWRMEKTGNPLFYYCLPVRKVVSKMKMRVLGKYKIPLALCDYHFKK